MMLILAAPGHPAWSMSTIGVEENERYFSVELSGKLALCTSAEKGEVYLDVKGGTPPYKYLWNNKETNSYRTNLFAGKYTVEITDSEGLKQVEHIVVQPPFPFIMEPVKITPASCGSSQDGKASLAVKIGRGEPYKVTWSNGLEDVWTAENLAPGTYEVVVADRYYCEVSLSFQVPAANEGIQVTGKVDPVTCSGNEDGRIGLQVSGGQPPYTYQWNTGQQSNTLSNLPPGLYSVEIRDQSACITNATYQVGKAPELSIESSQQDPTCDSGSNGAITLSVKGGIAPYQVTWDHGASGLALQNLKEGLYKAQIKDAAGCVVNQEFELKNPQSFEIKVLEKTHPDCAGTALGSISLALEGRIQSPKIRWSDGVEGTLTRTGLKPGTYQVMITDSKNCTMVHSFEIPDPNPLEVEVQTALDSFWEHRQQVGHAWVTISGGQAPYTIEWSTGEFNTKEIRFYENQTVEIKVKDAVGCHVTISALLEVASAPHRCVQLDFDFNKLEESLSNEFFAGDQIHFESFLDSALIAWEWDFGDGQLSTEKDPIYRFDSPGSYAVKLTGYDLFGHYTVKEHLIEIQQSEAELFIPTAFSPNGDGLNDVFFPKGKDAKDISLEIYTIWGEQIFQAAEGEASTGWDGTYHQQRIPEGNYLYRITYKDKKQKKQEKIGGITLVR